MKATSVKVTGNKDQYRIVEVVIVADSTPATLPTTGADVDGLYESDRFAPFSVLYVVDPTAAHQVYIANESGAFVAQ